MKCVVWTEKAVAQGTSQTGYPCRAIPLGWKAAPGLFLFKPFGQSCFGAWPALGTRTRAYRPGHLVPALPTGPNQSLRHASALLRQPLKEIGDEWNRQRRSISGLIDEVWLATYDGKQVQDQERFKLQNG